jgi:hypothetical protein
MTHSGIEPPRDRRWLTIAVLAWLGTLMVGFGAAYLVWTALAPSAANSRLAAESARPAISDSTVARD